MPRQQRSIEKKNKIILAGFELFSEKGYYNTNTAEIAKKAGVSTGIVYNYFKDKKDIFMEALDLYADQITSQAFYKLEKIDHFDNFDEIIHAIIDIFIQSHTVRKESHEEMLAMSHSDQEVREYFCNLEEKTTRHLTRLVENLGIQTENLHEKMHIMFNMVENLCHEIVYHKHDYINYDVMKEEIVKIIHQLLFTTEK
jgi:AcrR family transcriptional regulator